MNTSTSPKTKMPSISESLISLRNGDTNAFSDLYDTSFDRVYRMIYHRTLDTPLTEDIVSTVFMKAFRTIDKFRGETDGEYYSWILRIAYTTMIDALRASSPYETLEDHDESLGFQTHHAQDIDNKTKLEEVLGFMKTLTEREQTILTLRIWDELSYEEISAITGESVANAKQIISRSLAKISANVSYLFIITFILSYAKFY
ncbi:sigma-70 family RNA polymerase sigma factor [Candidatus Gracilibacteria bacterium]|nr:sigma-70 family RNA polymerase sigma factor [Candidatus Gracilibacteria bacterium]